MQTAPLENKADQAKNFVGSKTKIFNTIKKILGAINKIDIDDFLVAIFRSVFSKKVIAILGPFIIGMLSLLGLASEGYEAIKDAREAYQDMSTPQQKIKFIASMLAIMAAVVGVGLVIAYIAGGLGASVLIFDYMPFLIPTVLASMYGLALWKKSYTLMMAKEQENQDFLLYEKIKHQYEAELQFYNNRSKSIKLEEDEAQARIARLKAKDVDELSPSEKKQLTAFVEQVKCLQQELRTLKIDLEQIACQFSEAKAAYETQHQKKLAAEREVAFSTLEVLASTTALVGTVLGLTAFFSALTIASFGVIPAVLLLGGGAFGVCVKIFQIVDENNDNKYTNAIRSTFVHVWDKIFAPKNATQGEMQPIKSADNANVIAINSSSATPILKALKSQVGTSMQERPALVTKPGVIASLRSRHGNPHVPAAIRVPKVQEKQKLAGSTHLFKNPPKLCFASPSINNEDTTNDGFIPRFCATVTK